MPYISTLYQLDQLQDSGFGQPPPRHGLNLLYWFATEYIDFDHDQMVLKFSPWLPNYGFHVYKNKHDNNGVRLLPESNQSYYIVGNLNHYRANELPKYVTEHYTSFHKDSNMDRIIVSWTFTKVTFAKVYIAQHSDSQNFNPNTIHCISWTLLKKIRQMSRTDFLRKMTYHYTSDDSYSVLAPLIERENSNEEYQILMKRSVPRVRTAEMSRDTSCCDCCTIL